MAEEQVSDLLKPKGCLVQNCDEICREREKYKWDKNAFMNTGVFLLYSFITVKITNEKIKSNL